MAKAISTLDLADAQLIGFAHARRGLGVLSMIESMGLTREEWIEWKSKYTTSYLTPSEIQEIDSYFKVDLVKTRVTSGKKQR